MLVNELIKEFDFHDSNVIELIHKDDNLILMIDFCAWKQKEYSDGNVEIEKAVIEFENIQDFVWSSHKEEADIDYDTILNISCTGEAVKIALDDNGTTIIRFKCKSVNFAVVDN